MATFNWNKGLGVCHKVFKFQSILMNEICVTIPKLSQQLRMFALTN